VLIGLYPDAVELKGAMAAYLAAMPGGEAKSAGVRLGEAVAAGVLQARAEDGSEAADAYRPKARAGVYVPTAITVASTWPNLKPFILTAPSQFRPQPPIALGSEQWAADYNEIKALGGRTISKRSPRQTEDARFWLAPGPVIYYPVVRQVAAAAKLDLLDSARFMALVAMARNDAFVAVFDAKYHYDFWRPITAIRNGDIDDNPNTERDATWQPIDNTPLHPEYPCAHCISDDVVGGRGAVWHGGRAGSDLDEPHRAGGHPSLDQYVGVDRRGVASPHLGRVPLQVLNPGRRGHGPQDRPIRCQEHHATRPGSGRALSVSSAGLHGSRARLGSKPRRDADGDCQ